MTKLTETLRKMAKPALYIFVTFLFILFAWILWGTYKADNFGFGKTFWDWMVLLLVPAALAAAGAWFAYVQKKTELEIAEKARAEDRDIAEKARELDREISEKARAEDRETAEKARELDREIALERQRQQTLENYLDRMKELLLDRGLGVDAQVEVKRLARTLTLNVLRELEGTRNSQVIQFLQESELLGETEVVDLKYANLSKANLSKANLSKAKLKYADLRGADLRGANLHLAYLMEADLSHAHLSHAHLINACLIEADLSEAKLSHAKLSGADLRGAKLSGTKLSGADLSGADLSRARNWTATKLLQAISLEGATMPDGQKYEEWILTEGENSDEEEGQGNP